MKQIYFLLLISLVLLASFSVNAADSKMHISCAGDDAGAEILINGKFQGECPIDIVVPDGVAKLLARKEVDDQHEKVFEQYIRIGTDSAKTIQVVLSERLNAATHRNEYLLSATKHVEAAKREPRSRAEFDADLASGAIKSTFRDCADCPEMVAIPPGSFEMGSNSGANNSKPAHRVNINRDFAMGKTEVTQGQWKAIMGHNPSVFNSCGDNCPVEQVSWIDIQEFIQKLDAKTGKQYRLPSESEWEYAAKAGSTTAYPWGDQPSHEYANIGKAECCGGLVEGRDKWLFTSPTGNFPANAFGLYDMIGNVMEWTEDSYHDNYVGAPDDESPWYGDGEMHVLRGASWSYFPPFSRDTDRYGYEAGYLTCSFGFRLARMLP